MFVFVNRHTQSTTPTCEELHYVVTAHTLIRAKLTVTLVKIKNMPQKLSEAIVKQRLQQLRNLQKAHVRDLEKISLLESLVAGHEATIAGQQQQLDTQAIQIAELQTMVFGKRRPPPNHLGPRSHTAAPCRPPAPLPQPSISRRPFAPAEEG